MIDPGEIKWKPSDFMCPVCKERLLKTPSGYYACLNPDHTKLLGTNDAKKIRSKLFTERQMPLLKRWHRLQAKEFGDERDGLEETPVLLKTSIKNVYQIANDNRLFRVTTRDHLAEMKATRFYPKKRGGAGCSYSPSFMQGSIEASVSR